VKLLKHNRDLKAASTAEEAAAATEIDVQYTKISPATPDLLITMYNINNVG